MEKYILPDTPPLLDPIGFRPLYGLSFSGYYGWCNDPLAHYEKRKGKVFEQTKPMALGSSFDWYFRAELDRLMGDKIEEPYTKALTDVVVDPTEEVMAFGREAAEYYGKHVVAKDTEFWGAVSNIATEPELKADLRVVFKTGAPRLLRLYALPDIVAKLNGSAIILDFKTSDTGKANPNKVFTANGQQTLRVDLQAPSRHDYWVEQASFSALMLSQKVKVLPYFYIDQLVYDGALKPTEVRRFRVPIYREEAMKAFIVRLLLAYEAQQSPDLWLKIYKDFDARAAALAEDFVGIRSR